jgi:hypothetical protein
VQGGIVQQGREFGGVGYGKRLEVKSLSSPAAVEIDQLLTCPSSAVRTAQNSTRAPRPMRIAPHGTAVGATYALGWTSGTLPQCSTSTHPSVPATGTGGEHLSGSLDQRHDGVEGYKSSGNWRRPSYG